MSFWDDPTVLYLQSCQFGWGRAVKNSLSPDGMLHLVRGTVRGTPGPTLCGIVRFGPGVSGWDMGGGWSNANQVHKFCPTCAGVANTDFPGVMVCTSLKADYAEFGLVKGDSHAVVREAVLRGKATETVTTVAVQGRGLPSGRSPRRR